MDNMVHTRQVLRGPDTLHLTDATSGGYMVIWGRKLGSAED